MRPISYVSKPFIISPTDIRRRRKEAVRSVPGHAHRQSNSILGFASQSQTRKSSFGFLEIRAAIGFIIYIVIKPERWPIHCKIAKCLGLGVFKASCVMCVLCGMWEIAPFPSLPIPTPLLRRCRQRIPISPPPPPRPSLAAKGEAAAPAQSRQERQFRSLAGWW